MGIFFGVGRSIRFMFYPCRRGTNGDAACAHAPLHTGRGISCQCQCAIREYCISTVVQPGIASHKTLSVHAHALCGSYAGHVVSHGYHAVFSTVGSKPFVLSLIPSLMPLQVPACSAGSLYLRPLLLGSGSLLGLCPAPSYTFVVYACPVGTRLKVGWMCSH